MRRLLLVAWLLAICSSTATTASSSPSLWSPLPSPPRTPAATLDGACAAHSPALDTLFVAATGSNNTTVLLLAYDFAIRSWQQVPALLASSAPSSRQYATLTWLQDSAPDTAHFVLLGGESNAANTHDDGLIWLLTVTTSSSTNYTATWRVLSFALPPPPIGRLIYHQTILVTAAATATAANVVYVFGGAYQGQPQNWLVQLQINVDESGSNNTWRQIPSTSDWPSARLGHGLAWRRPGKLAVYAGRSALRTSTVDSSALLKDYWEFDLATERWMGIITPQTIEFALPLINNVMERAHFALHFAGDDVLVAFGGQVDVLSSTPPAPVAVNQLLVTRFSAASYFDNTTPLCRYAFWCAASSSSSSSSSVFWPTARWGYAWAVRGNASLVLVGGYGADDDEHVAWELNLSLLASGSVPLRVAGQIAGTLDGGGGRAPSASAPDPTIALAFFALILATGLVAFVVRRRRAIREEEEELRERNARILRVAQNRHFAALRALSGGGDDDADEETLRAAKAARAEVVRDLPLAPFADLHQDGEHGTCAICFEDFEPTSETCLLPCKHFFHPACVALWLSHHNVCPMCKAVVDGTRQQVEEV